MTTKRRKHETHLVEWKGSWRDEYLKWLCGCANADDGTPLIDMNDKSEPVSAQDTVTESRALARLHDFLLPHLLSGELPVDATEREVEAVA